MELFGPEAGSGGHHDDFFELGGHWLLAVRLKVASSGIWEARWRFRAVEGKNDHVSEEVKSILRDAPPLPHGDEDHVP
jgi:hypothetical protein